MSTLYIYHHDHLLGTPVTLMFNPTNTDDYGWLAGHLDDYDAIDISTLVESGTHNTDRLVLEIWDRAVAAAQEAGHHVC